MNIDEIKKVITILDGKLPCLKIVQMYNAIWYSYNQNMCPNLNINKYYMRFEKNNFDYIGNMYEFNSVFNYVKYNYYDVLSIFNYDIFKDLLKIPNINDVKYKFYTIISSKINYHKPCTFEEKTYYIYMVLRFIETYMVLDDNNIKHVSECIDEILDTISNLKLNGDMIDAIEKIHKFFHNGLKHYCEDDEFENKRMKYIE